MRHNGIMSSVCIFFYFCFFLLFSFIFICFRIIIIGSCSSRAAAAAFKHIYIVECKVSSSSRSQKKVLQEKYFPVCFGKNFLPTCCRCFSLCQCAMCQAPKCEFNDLTKHLTFEVVNAPSSSIKLLNILQSTSLWPSHEIANVHI